MSRSGSPVHRHGQVPRCGVLAVNLGTPSAPTAAAVRRYLAQFLGDRRVIELPRALWLPILHGVILPLRAPRSAHAYRQIWTEQGSPLLANSQALVDQLQKSLHDDGVIADVRLAMRYGSPSIPEVLGRWQEEGLRRLLVLPLYPQYSATTTATAFDQVFETLGRWRWSPELRLIGDYHDDDLWIDAVARSIHDFRQKNGVGDRLLLSFHGLPERYLHAGDPYFCQCQTSARRIAAALDLPADAWLVAFQSRVGRERWLQPYTDASIAALPAQGVRRLDVVCPGFAADCLETLEEIALRNAADFVAAGGEALRYIPALNDSPAHVQALAALIRRHAAGWPEFDPEAAARQARLRVESAAAHAAYAGPVGTRP